MSDLLPPNTRPMNVTINAAGFPTEGLANHGFKIWLAGVILIIAAGLFVGARTATRLSQQQMGSDDYAIIGALTTCLIQVSLWLMSVREGYGADYLMLNWQHQKLFNKYWYLGSLFYPLTLGLFKSSVLLLSKRIFVSERFQKMCWVVLVVNACWCIGNFLGTCFQCIPMDTMWGGTPANEAVCWNQDGLWISLVTWDISSDVVILAMPLPQIWALQLKTKEKAMLTGLFFLGAVVVVCSIMSCSAIATSLQATDKEYAYTFGLANLFQLIQSCIGIIGACLPILRQPLRAAFPKIFGTAPATSRQRRYYEDDQFTDEYVLQNYSGDKKGGNKRAWHDVSISGPEIFKSVERKSDEMHIIHNGAAFDNNSGGSWNEPAGSRNQDHIRKDMSYSVRSAR